MKKKYAYVVINDSTMLHFDEEDDFSVNTIQEPEFCALTSNKIDVLKVVMLEIIQDDGQTERAFIDIIESMLNITEEEVLDDPIDELMYKEISKDLISKLKFAVKEVINHRK
jgi:hypothetical protein